MMLPPTRAGAPLGGDDSVGIRDPAAAPRLNTNRTTPHSLRVGEASVSGAVDAHVATRADLVYLRMVIIQVGLVLSRTYSALCASARPGIAALCSLSATAAV